MALYKFTIKITIMVNNTVLPYKECHKYVESGNKNGVTECLINFSIKLTNQPQSQLLWKTHSPGSNRVSAGLHCKPIDWGDHTSIEWSWSWDLQRIQSSPHFPHKHTLYEDSDLELQCKQHKMFDGFWWQCLVWLDNIVTTVFQIIPNKLIYDSMVILKWWLNCD